MVTAYVMVKAATGDVDRLKSAIREIDDSVESVSVVAGDVDYVVKADVEDPSDMKAIATSIHRVRGIEDTQTYIAME